MPPRRSTRASSVEEGAQAPTRTSRRLRSRQDPNDSPLRALEAPSRRKRTASANAADPSTSYIPSKQEEEKDEDEKMEEDTAAGVPEWQARVVALLKRNMALSNAQHRDLTFSEITLLVNFGNAHDLFTGFEILNHSDVQAALHKCAHDMTDEQLINLAIRQLGEIVTLKDSVGNYRQSVKDAAHERDEVKERLADAQEEIRELQEKLQEKEQLENLKRSAPSGDDDENANEQRPAQRVKLTPSTRKSTTPKSTTPTTRLSLSSPLALANANRQSPQKTPLMNGGEEDEEDKEEDISFYPTQGRPSPSPVLNKYESFVAQRMRQKERERREQEWLGSAFKDPELKLPSESDDDMASNEDGSERASEKHVANTQESTRSSNAANSNNNGLTPIREESEPATPISRRWGFGSIIAPVTRLFGRTPKTEPARHIPRSHPTGTSAPTSTPSDSNSQPRRTSTGTSSSSRHAMNSTKDGEPVTPTPNYGITAASFLPQSAPQARSSQDRFTGEPGRRRRSHAERIKSYDAGVARRKKAEEQARQAEERVRQAEIEAEDRRLRAEARILRDQAIEAMQNTGEKRKVRVDDLAVIPNPSKAGYGMDDKFFEEDSDGEVYVDSDVSMMDAFTPPPAKKVRFSASPSTEHSSQKKPWWQTQTEAFNNVSPHIKTPKPSSTTDPNRAQPYTGSIFASTTKDSTPGGGQDRDAKKSPQSSSMSPKTYGQKHHVWTGPKTTEVARPTTFNWQGHFSVPDDSDSDGESEGTSKVEYPTTKSSDQGPKTPKKSTNVKHKSTADDAHTNVFMTAGENESGSKNGIDQEQSLVPPPPPTPAHAALPGTPAAVPNPNDSDALAKARSQAEKYKPKTPSGLRATSRLSSSPVMSNSGKAFGNNNIFGAAPTNNNVFGTAPANNNVFGTAPTNNNIFGTAPTAPMGQASSLFPESASGMTAHANNNSSIANNASAIATLPTDSQSSGENDDVPYERTLQYAIDLANAVPVDSLPPYEFEWPGATSNPFHNDPVIFAAIEEAKRHPDWAAYCDEGWKETWATYLQEKAAGLHDGPYRPPSTSDASPMAI